MYNKTWILGTRVWTADGFRDLNVLIAGEKIEKITEADPESSEGCRIIRAGGLYLLPGLVDMHVHLREPGYSYKETIKTGSEAGAAGGFTTVCTMPNLNPAPDSPENVEKQLEIIRRDACINVIPFATITKKRMGHELADYEALARMVAGFSDDGSGVQDEEVMRRAMQGIAKTGKILAAHCEVNDLIKGGYIHDGEYAKKMGHRGICSESEWKEVERDIRLAEETGCRLHICHVSTKESVQLVREAKAKGIKVTCETGPHYLTFCDADLQEHGRFKMNPPIRSIEDRDALRMGLIDGTVDVVATDHAPHSESEKSKGLEKSAMGVVGLETAFPAVYTTMVDSGLMSLERLVEAMALTPRKILGLPGADGISVGDDADLTLIDLNSETSVLGVDFRSMGSATPYEGMTLKGSVVLTFHKGQPVPPESL